MYRHLAIYTDRERTNQEKKMLFPSSSSYHRGSDDKILLYRCVDVTTTKIIISRSFPLTQTFFINKKTRLLHFLFFFQRFVYRMVNCLVIDVKETIPIVHQIQLIFRVIEILHGFVVDILRRILIS